MHEIPKHVDDIATHLVSDAIWDILRIVGALAISSTLIWLRKVGINSSKSRAGWSLIAIFFLVFLIWSAFQTHQRRGFFNGVLFVTDCITSLLLLLVVAYPFAKRFLPNGVKRLDWGNKPSLWVKYNAPGGNLDIAPQSDNSIRFGVHFSGVGDRWASMEVEFADAQNYRGWAGISLDIRSGKSYPGSTISLQMSTANGSQYLTGKPVSINNQTALFLFQEMWWADWTPRGPEKYLDLQQVVKVGIVCHTSLDDVEFSVSNFALVKYTDVILREGATT